MLDDSLYPVVNWHHVLIARSYMYRKLINLHRSNCYEVGMQLSLVAKQLMFAKRNIFNVSRGHERDGDGLVEKTMPSTLFNP